MMNPGNNGMQLNPIQIAEMMNQRYPEAAKNPNMQHMMQILQSGNEQEGIAYANQLLQTMGLSQKQGIQQVANFFGNGGFMK